MAVTIVVRAGGSEERELAITLDTPRLVIGRGEGCDVRLPDPSVGHRHASIRQRGGEHLIVDEGSANGTFLGVMRLPPQTPRVLRSGELVRVGRVWLEVRIEPAVVRGSTAAAAKELALELVARGLAAQGEEPWPRVTVLAGADRGKALVLADPGRRYVIGRAKDVDFPLDDAAAGRRHLEIVRKGDGLAIQDLGSGSIARLDDQPLGEREAAWRPGQELAIGAARLGFTYPAAEALAELERSPEERMRPGEASEPPGDPSAPPGEASPSTPAEEGTPTPSPVAGALAAPRARRKPDEGAWSVTDAAVVLLALGVLALSAAGAWWLLR